MLGPLPLAHRVTVGLISVLVGAGSGVWWAFVGPQTAEVLPRACAAGAFGGLLLAVLLLAECFAPSSSSSSSMRTPTRR